MVCHKPLSSGGRLIRHNIKTEMRASYHKGWRPLSCRLLATEGGPCFMIVCYLSACSTFCTLLLISSLTTTLKVLNHCLCEQGAILLPILKTNDILSGRVSLIRRAWPALPSQKNTLDPPRSLMSRPSCLQ
jgi:hypothetical protein